ncbi:hypothetical protein K1719_038131 [Acacia pycnantha]|nr:hypothetical protein K1719_038131 [Acacia pycnantha]
MAEREKRARGCKRGTESGGKEGLGGGDGARVGGNTVNKSSPTTEGTKFAFGSVDDKKEGDSAGPSRAGGGAASLSYRDKLLSPGCGGFLVKHAEEDDIVKGWKDYFNNMNEKDAHNEAAESEEEDDQMPGRSEGKPGTLKFSADEYAAWCLPWRNSLIIKVLGAYFPTYIVRDRINRMWRPKNPLKLIPLNNGYYIVSFSNKEDKEYAFQGGPWMIEDHYLIVQQWLPNFNPWKADLQCRIAAWIRLPDVPFEFYNVESLRRIGNMIGRMIKVDRSTSVYDKGGFARICVEIDLKQPLLPTYEVFGEERAIVYEGLHQVCFQCGKYGHQKKFCPLNQTKESKQDHAQKHATSEVGGDEGQNQLKSDRYTSSDTIVSGPDNEEECPFGKLKILRRELRSDINSRELRKEGNENSK